MNFTFDKDNPPPGEEVREYYRKQGEAREQERVIRKLMELADYRKDATWSPNYIIRYIKNGQL